MALVRPGFPGPQPGGAVPPTMPGGPYPHPGGDPGGPAWRPPTGLVDPLPGLRAAAGLHPAVAAAAGGVTPGGAAGYTPDNPYGPVVVTPHGAGYTASTLHPALGAILGTGPTNTGGHPVWGPTPPSWWPAGRPWPPGSGGGVMNPGGNPGGPPVAGGPVPQPWPWWLGGPPTQGL